MAYGGQGWIAGKGMGMMRMPPPPSTQEIEAFVSDRVRRGVESAVEQCKSMFEARVTSLEGHVDDLRLQLQQLSGDTQLSEAVQALRVEHAALRADDRALCECLVEGGVLHRSQLQRRRRVSGGLAALHAALDGCEAMLAVWRLSGDGGIGLCRLGAASPAFAGLRLAVKATRARPGGATPQVAEAGSPATDLDTEAWPKLYQYEPTQRVLENWAKSITVGQLLDHFAVQHSVGAAHAVRFTDVYRILQQMDMSLDAFVDKFTGMRCKRSAKELKVMADRILRRFARQTVETSGPEMLRCNDLFRLLEIIGYPLKRVKMALTGQEDPDDAYAQSSLKFGQYRVRGQIGSGIKGVICYLGEHEQEATRVAIKWPVKVEELLTFKELLVAQKGPSKDCLGMPQLFTSGEYNGKPYIVTELLGSPLDKVFDRLRKRPWTQRWRALCVIGRLVVRRLQSFHEYGFLHCDVAPGNILLGHARGFTGGSQEDSGGTPKLAFYLVDFEHTVKHPGGRRLEPECGSAEWSSTRTADGVQRLPEDDLEAVGWMLLHALYGRLPWMEWLDVAYKDWDCKWTRDHVIKQVQRAKHLLINEGWEAFGVTKSRKMPDELTKFFRACMVPAQLGKPNYGFLIELLGGEASLSFKAHEEEDLRQFALHVRPLL